ncbi:C40 family peptidase [Advenella alkanexedens]|uniref:C40 family peptidase n=1 Tax=Advenella alkanexedens TaxID=1481665 RepID=UPI002676E3E2|nr:C40 family peptidase [Advenella alkanexedens]WKU19298.1 C40 family peptidase [Advenella alkanexedens]
MSFRFLLCAFICALLLAGCSSSPKLSDSSKYARVDPAKRQPVMKNALSYIGTPYRYGGNHPEEGFDCSGFVNYVFNKTAKVQLPRKTSMIASVSRPVSKSALKNGDLVFFNTSGPYTHMGIYIGNNQFVHAPSSRNNGKVRVDSLNSRYFAQRFTDARTLFIQ